MRFLIAIDTIKEVEPTRAAQANEDPESSSFLMYSWRCGYKRIDATKVTCDTRRLRKKDISQLLAPTHKENHFESSLKSFRE